MATKILVVDDEESIVTLLKYNIEKAGFVVNTAYDGKTAVQMVEKSPYDLMVLDIMLPNMDGMAVTKCLRKRDINIPILMLTAKDDERSRVLGLDLGADDYLTKPFSLKEVIARIRAILRRTHQRYDQVLEVISIGDLMIYPKRHEVLLNERLIRFTKMEFKLLQYLAENAGIVLTRDKLLKEIWGYHFLGDSRIVDVHISRLREKIEENTKNPYYILTIHGQGYKMRTM